MTRSLVRIGAVAVFATVSIGCYAYVPQGPAPVSRGTSVRIRLARPRSFDLTSVTAHGIDRVTAEMVREAQDEVVLSAVRLASADGRAFAGDNRTFNLARADIASLEVRRVSVWRTALVAAGALVGTWLGFEAFGGGSAGSEGPGGGGDPH